MPSRCPLGKKPGPRLLGFADENDVDESTEIVLLRGHPRAADDDECAALLQRRENGFHAPTLNDHAGDADDVGSGTALEVDRLDILVANRDLVLRRRQRSKQRQTRNGQDRLCTDYRQRVLQPPIGGLEAWIDEDDIRHEVSASEPTA